MELLAISALTPCSWPSRLTSMLSRPAASSDLDYVRGLGAERAVEYKRGRLEKSFADLDVVPDTVGGDTQLRSLRLLKPGGILVSAVSPVSLAVHQA
jgi:NADPH:quinone reductase-like Zn-dependent oxidoreductase